MRHAVALRSGSGARRMVIGDRLPVHLQPPARGHSPPSATRGQSCASTPSQPAATNSAAPLHHYHDRTRALPSRGSAHPPTTARSPLSRPSARPGVGPAAAVAYPDASSTVGSRTEEEQFAFVCPICLQTSFRLAAMPTQNGGLSCSRCQRSFRVGPGFLDLTLTSGVQQRVYRQTSWGGTELFRSPLVSFVYERGWRQGFAWAGFPGADKEYDIAMSYLRPAAEGKVLVDMSCGSGLFSRRFARSGVFSGVIAADFSESMLQQTREYCLAEGGSLNGSTPIMLLRADVGRLPFATGSVAAIHAGAAIHCWPNPQAALAEISRVLAPGGVFVASTFLTATAPLGQVLGDDTVRPLNVLDPTQSGGPGQLPYRWWEEQELRDLCESVGLQDFRRERSWRFIMFAATKPDVGVLADWDGPALQSGALEE